MPIKFLNISEAEFLSKKKLYKHMSLENALATLNNHTLWFANPTIWKDPFESRFVSAKYVDNNKKTIDFPWIDRVFCACFTETAASEAYWTPYSQQQIGVEFRISRQELLRVLKNYADAYDIFIGKVEYMLTSHIKGPVNSIPFSAPIPTKNSKEWWARLLLLKRVAYRYEDEIRIIIVKRDKTLENGIQIKYHCPDTSLIDSIVLDPTIGKYTEELLKDTFANKYGFTPIANRIGRRQPRVLKSQLYAKLTVKALNI